MLGVIGSLGRHTDVLRYCVDSINVGVHCTCAETYGLYASWLENSTLLPFAIAPVGYNNAGRIYSCQYRSVSKRAGRRQMDPHTMEAAPLNVLALRGAFTGTPGVRPSAVSPATPRALLYRCSKRYTVQKERTGLADCVRTGARQKQTTLGPGRWQLVTSRGKRKPVR